ncbi:MAG: Ig-like domain-containing protein, partial [Myxococcota bacterium]|nr:Ig-like domain-containing protein [Myxococcota bacterium]
MPLLRKSFFIVALFFAVGCGDAFLESWRVELENYRVVAETRIGRTLFEYRLRADCRNDGPYILDQAFLVHSQSAATEVVSGNLRCGPMLAGGVKEALGEIVLRQDRRVPFDPTSLRWIAAGYGPATKRSETRTGRTTARFGYEIVWTSSEDAALSAIAHVSSESAATLVEVDRVTGEPTPVEATMGDPDFAFEQERTVPFDPLSLQWSLERVEALPFALGLTQTLDANGHPLGGVSIEDAPAPAASSFKAGAQPATARAFAETPTSDAESGAATLGGEAGVFTRRFSKQGYLPVWRRFALQEGEVERVPGPWLTRQSDSPASLTVLNGGRVEGGGLELDFAGGSLTAPTQAWLTPLSAQALPAPLPLGWSPLQAFWLELEGDAQAQAAASAALWAPVGAGESVVVARFVPAAMAWQRESIVAGQGSSALAFEVPGPGPYALVVADTGEGAPPLPTEEEPELQPSSLGVADPATLSASGEADPPMRTASLDPDRVVSTAHVTIAGEAHLPSGTPVRTEIFDAYLLRGGQEIHPPGHLAFLSTYRRPAAPGSSVAPDRVHARFPLRPQRLLDASQLVEASVGVDILAVENFEVGALTEQGGRVVAPGIEIAALSGDLEEASPVELRSLDPERFASLLDAGSEAVRGFDLGVRGVAVGRSLRAVFGGVAANAHFVLARVIEGHGRNGLEPVERFESDGVGNLASVEPAAGDRLPGITRAGRFVLVRVAVPQALVVGTARDAQGNPAAGLAVRIEGRPWLTFSKAEGAFVLVAPVGDAQLVIDDPATGNRAALALQAGSAGSVVRPEVTLVPTPPCVTAVTPVVEIVPADSCLTSVGFEDNDPPLPPKADTVTPIAVQFSEPLDPQHVGEDALTLGQVDSEGTPVEGTAVAGTLHLNLAGDRLSFLPDEPLEAEKDYRITLNENLLDRSDLALAGQRAFDFTTEPRASRGLGAKLVICEPGSQKGIDACILCKDPETGEDVPDCQGVPGAELELSLGTSICVVSSQGAADSGVPVILVNDTTGMTSTVLSNPDGSFMGSLLAGEEDFVSATFVNANDTRIRIPVQRQLYDDGSVGLYPGGGILEASNEEAGEVKVFIAPEAVESRTKFKITPLSLDLIDQLMGEDENGVSRSPANGGKIVGGFQLELSGGPVDGGSEVEVAFTPEESDEPENQTFQLAIAREIDGQTVYEVADKMRYEDGPPGRPGRLKTNTFPFMGFIGALFGPYNPAAAGDTNEFNLAVIQLNGGSIALAGQVCESNAETGTLVSQSCSSTQGRVVPGAFVRFEPASANFSATGRIQAGMVYATSELTGDYALSVSDQAGEGVLFATHPRFSRPASTVAEGFLSPAAVFNPSGNFSDGFNNDLVFRRTANESGVGARRPEMALTHSPVYPSAGETVEVRGLLSHSKADQWECFVELAGVAPLSGTAVEESAIEVGAPSQESLGDGRKLSCTAAVQIPLEIPAVVSVEVRFEFEPTFPEPALSPISRVTRIAFDGTKPTGSGVLAAADPEDGVGPVVESSFPASGWQGFSPGDAIVLHFNEPVDDALVDDISAVTLSPSVSVAATAAPPGFSLTLSGDQRTLTVVPSKLQPATGYALSVGTGVVDLAGNAFDQDPATDGPQPFALEFETQEDRSTPLPGLSYGRGVAVRGGYAFALDAAGTGSLKIYDVSVPSDPFLVSETLFPSPPRDLALIPDYSFKLRPEDEPRRADLLVAVGGDLEITTDPDNFNTYIAGQYLRVFD